MDKAQLRDHYKDIRQVAYQQDQDQHSIASRLIAAQLLEFKVLRQAKYIAGYMPINNEIDAHLIMKALHVVQYQCSLPVITTPNTALSFKAWNLEDDLIQGAHNILEPASDNEAVTPDIILVPLLAFDKVGHRLGYGGGYYDRTLANLKQINPNVIAIGVAYEQQMCEQLPTDNHDIKLDYVITDQNFYSFNDQ